MDIAACDGNMCPKKVTCLRYTEPTEFYQVFIIPTLIGEDCEFFIKNDTPDREIENYKPKKIHKSGIVDLSNKRKINIK